MLLPIQDLRDRATAHGSVNVPLATRHDLRWHDPAWLAAWERWRRASAAWEAIWRGVPFKHFDPDHFSPNPSVMVPAHRVVAEEYLAARTAYLDLNRQSLDLDEKGL